MSAGISLTQQAEIGQMRGWLQAWGLPPTGTEPAMSWMGHPQEGRMPRMADPEEIDDLRRVFPEEADVRFLQLMISHHEAAVPMAEAVLEETDRKEVEQFATAVVASQQAESARMKNSSKDAAPRSREDRPRTPEAPAAATSAPPKVPRSRHRSRSAFKPRAGEARVLWHAKRWCSLSSISCSPSAYRCCCSSGRRA